MKNYCPMIRTIVAGLLVVLFATPARAVTSSALLLKCQKAMEGRVRSLTTAASTKLRGCTLKVVNCKLAQEIDGSDPTRCLASATRSCSRLPTKVATAYTRSRDKAAAACGSIPLADLVPFVGGLGFFNVAATCSAADVAGLLTCLFDDARCSAEHQTFILDPRAQDSLTTAGIAASFPCVTP